MFRGSLPTSALSIINEIVLSWRDVTDVYIGCAGNFTIERGLAEKAQHLRLHGNDVTMYSCTLGAYYAKMPWPVTLRPEYEEEFGWLRPYVADPAGVVTTVMLCTRLLEGFGKDNPYYQRMTDAYRDQWDTLYAKTRAKVEKAPLHLASFFPGDVVDWVDTVPRDQAFVCFPPFFAGDYENLFAKLDAIFDWPKPSYPEMDDFRRELLFKRMMSKRHWIFGTHQKQPHLDGHLYGLAQTTNRGVPIYVYGSEGKNRIVVPSQKVDPVTIPRLMPGQEIGSRLALMKLTGGQFQALRSQYMNINIKPGSAMMTIGVLVDGVLVGVFAMNLPSATANWTGKVPDPYVYLLSDFPVAPTDYDRLAKLVLYAALSKEAKRLAERMTGKRVRGIVTTAFTKRPASMKYRGLFDLLNRKEKPAVIAEDASPADAYYSQGYELNYGSPMGRWTLAEGLAEWKKKHGQRRQAGAQPAQESP